MRSPCSITTKWRRRYMNILTQSWAQGATNKIWLPCMNFAYHQYRKSFLMNVFQRRKFGKPYWTCPLTRHRAQTVSLECFTGQLGQSSNLISYVPSMLCGRWTVGAFTWSINPSWSCSVRNMMLKLLATIGQLVWYIVLPNCSPRCWHDGLLSTWTT